MNCNGGVAKSVLRSLQFSSFSFSSGDGIVAHWREKKILNAVCSERNANNSLRNLKESEQKKHQVHCKRLAFSSSNFCAAQQSCVVCRKAQHHDSCVWVWHTVQCAPRAVLLPCMTKPILIPCFNFMLLCKTIHCIVLQYYVLMLCEIGRPWRVQQ